MTDSGLLTIAGIVVVWGAPLLNADELASYRGMQFGMSLAEAAKQAGMNPKEARAVHQQPDRYKIEEMTVDDMIEVISADLRCRNQTNEQISCHSVYEESTLVVARWENSQYAHNLVRTGDRSSFALVLYSKRLDALARAATVEAIRLDTEETPQLAIEKRKKQVTRNASADSRLPGYKANATDLSLGKHVVERLRGLQDAL